MIQLNKPAPERIPYYNEKAAYLLRISNCCAIAESQGQKASCDEFHHAHINNSKMNRRRFPLFIHSILNIYLVSEVYHQKYKNWGRLTDYQAGQIEQILERYPGFAEFVNKLDPGNHESGEWFDHVIREQERQILLLLPSFKKIINHENPGKTI